ncbi:MAG: sugar nucleotide-binding protein [Actinomycetota bacterium]
MKVWLTGGTGFVGSNIVHVALERGCRVMTTVHQFQPAPNGRYEIDSVDLSDPNAVAESIDRFGPDVVVHAAILNDLPTLYQDRQRAWDAYVTASANVAAAAQAVGSSMVVVSTDWVFDGTQGGADEATPPNPVNFYGVLKLVSEIVTLDRGGAVARISGVNGIHRARPDTPRQQDPGFGYFVAALVDALRGGRPFTVWESPRINMIATPSLASDSAGLILDIGKHRLTGIFHCCGRDTVERMELALLACEVFGLDQSLVGSGPPEQATMASGPIPYDTSLTSPRTDRLLSHRPLGLAELLNRFRGEYESATR